MADALWDIGASLSSMIEEWSAWTTTEQSNQRKAILEALDDVEQTARDLRSLVDEP